MILYFLNFNGTEAGPYTLRQLRAMWLSGAVTVNVPWRESKSTDWQTGSMLPKMLEGDEETPGDSGPIWTPAAIRRRKTVRAETAYPVARGLISTLVWLFVLGAVAAWALVIIEGGGGYGSFLIPVAVTISAAGYSALALVGQALLDLADCQLADR